VETSEQLVTAPPRWKQWALAIVGLLLAAWALGMQIMLLIVLAPKFGHVFADMGVRYPAIRLMAAWHWPLLALLVLGQAFLIALAARKRQFGVWLLIAGGVMWAATTVAMALFGSNVTAAVQGVVSALESSS
jgi:type II secretory pathway component PulF